MSAAVAVAQKIREAVSQPLPIGQEHINITTSIGIALADSDIEAHRLLRNADAALYEAKHSEPTASWHSTTAKLPVPNHRKQPSRVNCEPGPTRFQRVGCLVLQPRHSQDIYGDDQLQVPLVIQTAQSHGVCLDNRSVCGGTIGVPVVPEATDTGRLEAVNRRFRANLLLDGAWAAW